MAYSTTAHVTLGQLKSALERVKAEYEEADSNIASESVEVATDDEAAEMLEEVFASDTEEADDSAADESADGTE